MKKDAFYFPHFSNARHDRKLKRVQKDLGIEGYGIYFMLLEVLREQINFKYPLQDVDLLADEFGCSEVKIKALISKYELFEIDELNNFFSIKQVQYLQPYISASARASEAARIRWDKAREQLGLQNDANADANALPMQSESSTDAMQVKENKRKETKVNDIDSRLEAFKQQLVPFLDTYGKDILNPFYKYWSEPNKSKTKLKFELEKTWDLERRLERWSNNNFKPIKKIENEQPHVPTADKAAIAAKYGKPHINS